MAWRRGSGQTRQASRARSETSGRRVTLADQKSGKLPHRYQVSGDGGSLAGQYVAVGGDSDVASLLPRITFHSALTMASAVGATSMSCGLHVERTTDAVMHLERAVQASGRIREDPSREFVLLHELSSVGRVAVTYENELSAAAFEVRLLSEHTRRVFEAEQATKMAEETKQRWTAAEDVIQKRGFAQRIQ